ncbi:hypothetical protein P885DRAFT_80558 [Corynascus similis CBS 632.67]
MCRMEYQVVTTFTPGGRLHRTEQFSRRQGHNPALSPPTQPPQPPPEPPRHRLATPLAAPPLTMTSSPAMPGLEGAPAMTVSQQGPPQIKFPRTLRSVADLYQLWRYGFGMMPSIDELEKR